MKQYIIEDVLAGVSKGGMACGPVDGRVIAEVRLRSLEDGTVTFHSLSEDDGGLTFAVTDESTFEGQIREDFDDAGFWNMITDSQCGAYDGYDEFYEALEEGEIGGECALIRKYLAYIVRADWDEIEEMKKNSIGKVLGAFAIPVCDAEEEYLEGKDL